MGGLWSSTAAAAKTSDAIEKLLQRRNDLLKNSTEPEPRRRKELESVNAEIKRLSQKHTRIANLQIQHHEISANHDAIQTALEKHASDVEEACAQVCSTFYNLTSRLIKLLTATKPNRAIQREEKDILLAKMHACLSRLDSLLQMHATESQTQDPCCVDPERASRMLQKMSTHVLSMWDFVQDFLNLVEGKEEDSEKQYVEMVSEDMRNVRNLLGDQKSAFAGHSKFLGSMRGLEAGLAKFVKEANGGEEAPKSYTTIISSEQALTDGLLQDVRDLVWKMLQAKGLKKKLKVEVSFESGDATKIRVSVDVIQKVKKQPQKQPEKQPNSKKKEETEEAQVQQPQKQQQQAQRTEDYRYEEKFKDKIGRIGQRTLKDDSTTTEKEDTVAQGKNNGGPPPPPPPPQKPTPTNFLQDEKFKKKMKAMKERNKAYEIFDKEKWKDATTKCLLCGGKLFY